MLWPGAPEGGQGAMPPSKDEATKKLLIFLNFLPPTFCPHHSQNRSGAPGYDQDNWGL